MRRSPRTVSASSHNSSRSESPVVHNRIAMDNGNVVQNPQANVNNAVNPVPASNVVNRAALDNVNPVRTTQSAITEQNSNVSENMAIASNGVLSSTSSNIILSQEQFRDLIGGFNSRSERRTTFGRCSARFDGGRSAMKVEDFIDTILVFKEAENVSDELALTSLPLILDGYALSWWHGIKNEATSFEIAIDLLRKAFSPPKPDWRIFAEINMEKQTTGEATDIFICKKRRLFAQLAEKLSETTMLNIIYSQILLSIRERIPRDSVNCFQDLLQRARDVEMLLTENKKAKIFIQASDDSDKILMRCTFCRKKNHTSETCYKKLEADRKGKPKVKESTISCYGCGLAGYYRSKCPNCNKKNPINSPERLDFNSIQTSIIGRNVPTVGINISGLKGTAYFDTAARTSVAGYTLFQKLKEKKAEFQKVVAEIVLADGVAKKEVVYSTIADIIIGGRFKRIRMICLPNAKGNRTLIGIDFLEQAGIVLDLAQRIWHFKDNPNSNF